jgi:glycerophosphoryl diester phosphodiesterase
MPALRRVGHKGADLIAPGNTLASFDAALEAGVDMIEFDVLPERGTRRLVLAHDYVAAERGSPPTLEEGLAHFASEGFTDIDLDVDLKLPGYEDRVVDALREHGLVDRALISTQYVESLDRLRAMDRNLRLGWSVPKVRRDYTRSRWTLAPALAILSAYKADLPRRAAAAVRQRRCDALMAHWRLVTPRLVRAVGEAGGQLFVWTVDEEAQIRRFEELGVTGVITNDPRLFGNPPFER